MKLKFNELKQSDWSKQKYLTEDQRKQLIEEKVERARLYHLMQKQRENGHHTIR
jgi:hypothetical protein